MDGLFLGAALLKRVSAALENPRLSTETFLDQSQIVTSNRASVEVEVQPRVSSGEFEGTEIIPATLPPTLPETPGEHAQNGVASEPSPAGKRGLMRLPPYLTPFGSRSSAKIAAENANSNTGVIATGDGEELRLASSVSDEVVSKPGRRLSKKQHRISHTTVSVKNILSGDLSSSPTTPLSPKLRANRIASSQTKIAPKLLHEEKANRVISEIRQLSPLGRSQRAAILSSSSSSSTQLSTITVHTSPPAVHGVCLEKTDEEAETTVFSKLAPTTSLSALPPSPSTPPPKPTVSASPYTLADVLSQLNLVNFLQVDPTNVTTGPTDPENVAKEVTLMGALPSPAVVAGGVNDMATQLIALGLGDPKSALVATSPDLNGLLPDHTGVYPPTDRMSVITCEFNIHDWDNVSVTHCIRPIDWYGITLVYVPAFLNYV